MGYFSILGCMLLTFTEPAGAQKTPLPQFLLSSNG